MAARFLRFPPLWIPISLPGAIEGEILIHKSCGVTLLLLNNLRLGKILSNDAEFIYKLRCCEPMIFFVQTMFVYSRVRHATFFENFINQREKKKKKSQ